MIENLQDELYQLRNKQTKDAKNGTTLLWVIVGGYQNANFGEKTLQVRLIIIIE